MQRNEVDSSAGASQLATRYDDVPTAMIAHTELEDSESNPEIMSNVSTTTFDLLPDDSGVEDLAIEPEALLPETQIIPIAEFADFTAADFTDAVFAKTAESYIIDLTDDAGQTGDSTSTSEEAVPQEFGQGAHPQYYVIADDDNTSTTISFPPPNPFGADTSEEVPHRRSSHLPKTFTFAMGLFVERFGISTRAWEALGEVLQISTISDELASLPLNVIVFKKHTRSHLPLLPLRRKEVEVEINQQPSLAPSKKNKGKIKIRRQMMYWLDPIHLVQKMLSAPAFMKNVHVGMARLVDAPAELWESTAWGSSIRATSGEYACFPGKHPLFPSDIVRFVCPDSDCNCRSEHRLHTGRVIFVGMDKRKLSPRPGEVIIEIQHIFAEHELPEDLHGLIATEGLLPPDPQELILIEDNTIHLHQEDVFHRRVDIFLDYDFGMLESEVGAVAAHNIGSALARKCLGQDFYIKRVMNIDAMTIRPLNMLAPPRGELEIKAFGRDVFVKNASRKCFSLPIMSFIDGFGLYRNMHRTLKGWYASLAGMSASDRDRRINVFHIALGPHGSDFNDVVEALQILRTLDVGMEMEINGEKCLVTAFALCYVGDMPQQNENSGIRHQGARHGCRRCKANREGRGDVLFDIILNGRYHEQLIRQRKYLNTLNKTGKTEYCRATGLSEKPSPLEKISPALDLGRSRPGNPAHAEYAGMGKRLQDLLFEAILMNRAQEAYVRVLQNFKFLAGWPRFQSPVTNLDSWRMQEAARSLIVTPVLLRTWLTADKVRPRFLEAIEKLLPKIMKKMGFDAVDTIVYLFHQFAVSGTAIVSREMPEDQRKHMEEILIRARRGIQKMYEAAAIACSKPVSLPDTNTTTPAPNRGATTNRRTWRGKSIDRGRGPNGRAGRVAAEPTGSNRTTFASSAASTITGSAASTNGSSHHDWTFLPRGQFVDIERRGSFKLEPDAQNTATNSSRNPNVAGQLKDRGRQGARGGRTVFISTQTPRAQSGTFYRRVRQGGSQSSPPPGAAETPAHWFEAADQWYIASPKALEWLGLRSIPNVHQARHYPTDTIEIATPNNCNTMIYEDKYKDIKDKVLQTNYRDVEKPLLMKESVQQTVRFLNLGAFSDTDPELTQMMGVLGKTCPALIAAYSPASESVFHFDDPQQDLGVDTVLDQIELAGDNKHFKPSSVANCHFASSLRWAFAREYQKPNIFSFGRLPLQWCRRLSYDDHIKEQRFTFNSGDFVITALGEIVRIDYFFVHQSSTDERRAFVLCRKTFDPEQQDRVIPEPILHLTEENTVIGLPALISDKVYIISVQEKLRLDGTVEPGKLQIGGTKLLIHLDMDIEFL
ncbi:MAG: hypothetical protein MMC33_010234 [Icmadophila ericetorum]|nr:hypothetical protein [Icmadophila ericetorum]